MKRLFASGAIVLLGHIAGVSHAQAGENADQAWVTQNLTSMPLAFTQNMGQWDQRALFRADAGGATMWITTEGVYYQFTHHLTRRITFHPVFPAEYNHILKQEATCHVYCSDPT
jgi:hypothetical protein